MKGILGFAMVIVVAIIFVAYSIIRRLSTENMKAEFLEDCKQLYLHGEKLFKWIDEGALNRFTEWIGGDYNNVSVLAMIAMHRNSTSALCYGAVDDKPRIWVEFRGASGDVWVVDLTTEEVFLEKKNYPGVREYRIPYDIFWDIPLADVLLEAMRNPESSNIMFLLTAFSDSSLRDVLYKPEDVFDMETLGEWMIPYYLYDELDKRLPKIISTKILRGFVDKSTRRQPKERWIRLARKERKDFLLEE